MSFFRPALSGNWNHGSFSSNIGRRLEEGANEDVP